MVRQSEPSLLTRGFEHIRPEPWISLWTIRFYSVIEPLLAWRACNPLATRFFAAYIKVDFPVRPKRVMSNGQPCRLTRCVVTHDVFDTVAP